MCGTESLFALRSVASIVLEARHLDNKIISRSSIDCVSKAFFRNINKRTRRCIASNRSKSINSMYFAAAESLLERDATPLQTKLRKCGRRLGIIFQARKSLDSSGWEFRKRFVGCGATLPEFPDRVLASI
eukprot:GHVU01120161.1.p1 GENE.GHVU01120161.1~~GHVU01120161.1.p1  ORF type:complete len:130 (+),score=0.20 GHVU01120161.1:461-850(+)